MKITKNYLRQLIRENLTESRSSELSLMIKQISAWINNQRDNLSGEREEVSSNVRQYSSDYMVDSNKIRLIHQIISPSSNPQDIEKQVKIKLPEEE